MRLAREKHFDLKKNLLSKLREIPIVMDKGFTDSYLTLKSQLQK